MIEPCADDKPRDYDTSASSKCNEWTCQDWANAGYCDRPWHNTGCTGSYTKMKHTCKASCNNCGKSPVHLYAILQ